MRIHKITRRNFMKAAGVSALAMGLAACGGSSSTSTAASTAGSGAAAGGEVTGDKVVINIGHINDQSDSWHQGALKFKEYCEANSNGTIEVDVFPNSQLGPEVDMIQGILSDSGTVDIGTTVKIGHFSQEGRELDLNQRVYDFIYSVAAQVKTDEGTFSAKTMLERFLFPPDLQQTTIGRLSGGERRRLYLLSILILFLMGASEEIFWRGYIQQVFSERWGANTGYVLTTLLFASMYVWSFNWMLIVGSLLLSMLWGGLCRLDSRWLSPVMLSHALLNVIVFVLFPI